MALSTVIYSKRGSGPVGCRETCPWEITLHPEGTNKQHYGKKHLIRKRTIVWFCDAFFFCIPTFRFKTSHHNLVWRIGWGMVWHAVKWRTGFKYIWMDEYCYCRLVINRFSQNLCSCEYRKCASSYSWFEQSNILLIIPLWGLLRHQRPKHHRRSLVLEGFAQGQRALTFGTRVYNWYSRFFFFLYQCVIYYLLKISSPRFHENMNLSAAGVDNAAFLERCDRGGFGLL